MTAPAHLQCEDEAPHDGRHGAGAEFDLNVIETRIADAIAQERIGDRIEQAIRSTHAADEVVAAANHATAQRRLRWFAAISTASLLLCASAGVVAAYRAVIGFDSPNIVRSRGEISIGITGQPLGAADGVRISYSYLDQPFAAGDTRLELTFPSSAIGRRWVIVLQGPAVLDHAVSLSDDVGPITFVYHSCLGEAGLATLASVPCQVIEGTVSPYLDRAGQVGEVSDSSLCNIGDQGYREDYTTHAQSVLIVGKSDNVTAATWAQKTISLPAFRAWGVDTPLAPLFSDLPIKADAIEPEITSVCTAIDIPKATNISSIADPQPTERNEFYLLWKSRPADAQVPQHHTVGVRNLDADEVQNALLIAAGVLFTIGGGFVPVLIQTIFALERPGRRLGAHGKASRH